MRALASVPSSTSVSNSVRTWSNSTPGARSVRRSTKTSNPVSPQPVAKSVRALATSTIRDRGLPIRSEHSTTSLALRIACVNQRTRYPPWVRTCPWLLAFVASVAGAACDDGGVIVPVADAGLDAADADAASPDAASPDAASPDAAPGQRLREVVDTDLGALRGVRDGERLVFRGVPYAEAPVGELRWRAPVNVSGWDGTHDATGNAPVCPQLESWGAEPPQCSA
ncbi:MAG: hypothetical protein DRJ42_30645, partial [Deltaproteobacteria bacterium]